MAQKVSTRSLNITFAGVEFSSPIGVGPVGRPFGKNVTPEMHAEILLKHAEAGASHICIPTCKYLKEETLAKLQETAIPEERPPLHPKQVRTMRIETPLSPYGLEGLYFLSTPFWKDIETERQFAAHSEELTKILMEKKSPEVRLIANVTGLGGLPETYVDGAKRYEELGVDLIEINVSCPVPTTEGNAVEYYLQGRFPARWHGALIGETPDLVEKITREVVKAVNIPVGVKLSGETGFPRLVGIARRTKDAGAKWIQAINLPVGIAPPDIYNRGKPLWPFCNTNPFVGASGAFLRVQCYKHVAAIAKFVPGLDVAAAGGLVMPQHVVEVMMLGAGLAQLCTGVIEQGRKLIRRSDSFLKRFMEEQGYQTVEDIIGLGQQYIKGNEEVDFTARTVVSETDELKCNGCGICVDNICVARYWDNGTVKVIEEHCSGCGACILACPTDAITLVARD